MLGLEAGQVMGAGHSGVEVWSGGEGKLGTRRGRWGELYMLAGRRRGKFKGEVCEYETDF